MAKYFYPAIFHEEEKGYSVSFPDLDGCFSEGDTLSETYEMAFDAIGLYLTDLLENKKEIPCPSLPRNISVENGDCIILIEFDMSRYLKRSKSIKKTLTIPTWLNEEAEKRHINFSGVLQEALIERIETEPRV